MSLLLLIKSVWLTEPTSKGAPKLTADVTMTPEICLIARASAWAGSLWDSRANIYSDVALPVWCRTNNIKLNKR